MKLTVNLQFRAEQELVSEMDRQAKLLGMSRTELLRYLVYNHRDKLAKDAKAEKV